MAKKTKKVNSEEKAVNVVDFDEVKNRKNQTESKEDYFSQQNLRVTRGELYQVLEQVLGNVDNELIESFQRVVVIHNLVDVVVQALVEKGLLTDEDLKKAQDTLIDELEKQEKEGNEDGSK